MTAISTRGQTDTRNAGITSLPRLLYLGDVPVEASYHGSALLFRLLQNYPADRLLIVESNLASSLQDRRLPNVRYATLRIGNTRLLRTRFAPMYSSWLTLVASHRFRRVVRVLAGFRPEAVLTVAHGYLWQTAAEFARKDGLPLHVICHDDWPRVAKLPFLFARQLDRKFKRVYRQAATRLPVSPYMEENYSARYGAPGIVLYPSRAVDCLVFDAPPESLKRTGRPLNFVFAGTINTPGYIAALQQLADVLGPSGHKLLIFGPYSPKDATAMRLDRSNILFSGMIAAHELVKTLRNVADVLFVPMSFSQADRENMQFAFPSKLTDCTAVGIPLLIVGPEYSSVIRWARENPRVAEVVTSDDAGSLDKAVERLADPQHRIALSRESLAVGKRMFAHQAVWETFCAAIRNGADS